MAEMRAMREFNLPYFILPLFLLIRYIIPLTLLMW